MRGLFTWLLLFGVIAGLCGRVLSLDHDHGHRQASECCGHSHDGDAPPDEDSHGPDCPPWPHDHHAHACCHPAPLAGADSQARHPMPPGSSLLGVTWSTALPPDEPVFALDKPPLI